MIELEMTRILISALTLSLVLANGCDSTKPPIRPDYEGSDQITSIDTEQLIGTWLVTSLNPYPEEGEQQTVIEYRSDGTVGGQIKLQGEGAAALGSTAFTLSGEWNVDGDTVTHSHITMEESSGSAMGALLSKIVNSSTRNVAGSANVFEMSAERIVMVGTDGAAMQYIRQ